MTNKKARHSPTFFYGYIIVFGGFIIAAIAEGMLYSFGIFFEPLLAEFGWTRTMTAGASSVSGLLVIPIFFVAGSLTDRFGPKKVLTACGLSFGAGFLLMSQTSAIWHLYLFYGMFVGIGLGLYWIPLISILPRWFVSRRALMMGIIASGIGVGQLIYPPVATWLISVYGWRISYLIIGSISMAIIITVAQFLRLNPQQMGLLPYGESEAKQDEPGTEGRGFSLREAISTKQFWIFCVIWFFWVFCLGVVLVHSVIHATGLGMSPTNAAYILSIIGITGIIGRLAFGRLADVTSMKPVLITSFVLMAIAFFLLVIAEEAWLVYLFAVTFGISYGVIETLESPVLADLFGLNSISTITGAATAIGSIGFVFGPVIAGYIFDVTNSYQIAFLISAAMEIISAILCVFLPLTKGKGK